jgi:hypothetical protein
VTQFEAPPVPIWRRVCAVPAALLTVAAAAVAVLGTWNPWDLVVLRQNAGDPVLDLFVLLLLALIASWLASPITSEAAQRWRLLLRAWLIGLTVFVGLASLVTWGLQAFRYDPQVLARSPDGQRSVALIEVLRDRQLHAYAGSGLATRDMGNLGSPCGLTITARFTGPDQVRVETDYGTFDLSLDPATGRPVKGMGPTCSG